MLYFLVVNFNQFSQPRSSLSPQQAIFLKDSWQKVKSVLKGKWPIQLELIPVSIAWCGQEYYYFPLNRIPIHCKVSSQYFIKLPWQFMSTYLLYSGVERSTTKVQCFVHEDNTMTQPGLKPGLSTMTPAHCVFHWITLYSPYKSLLEKNASKKYCQGKEKEIPKVGCDADKKKTKFWGYNKR